MCLVAMISVLFVNLSDQKQHMAQLDPKPITQIFP